MKTEVTAELLGQRLLSVRLGMTFAEVLGNCVRNRDLVTQFDRLRGTNLSMRGSPIELMIDESSGRLGSDLERFIEFCWDAVFLRM